MQSAVCQPGVTVDAVIAAVTGVGAVITAVTVVAIQVAKNTKDIRAAWAQVHVHEKVLNGAIEAHQKGQDK